MIGETADEQLYRELDRDALWGAWPMVCGEVRMSMTESNTPEYWMDRLQSVQIDRDVLREDKARLMLDNASWESTCVRLQSELADKDRRIAELEEQVKILKASAKGDRICMWCRAILEIVPGDEIGNAARLADHLLHCKDHPLAKMLDKQGAFLKEITDAYENWASKDADDRNADPAFILRLMDIFGDIEHVSAPTLGELHAEEVNKLSALRPTMDPVTVADYAANRAANKELSHMDKSPFFPGPGFKVYQEVAEKKEGKDNQP